MSEGQSDRHPPPDWEPHDELPEAIQSLRGSGPGLMSALPAMVYQALVEPAWPMIFVSPGARAVTGYPPEALAEGGDRAFGDLIHSDDEDRVWEDVRAAVENRTTFSIEYRITHADGQQRHVWDHGHGVYARNGDLLCVEGAIFDVTDRVLLEAKLNHSQRQETIGRLAGVVCHDFNNYLTGIISSIELGMRELDPEHTSKESFQVALTAANRARALTRQLLLLGKARPPKPEVIDLNDRLRSLRKFLDQVIGSPVTLTLELGDGEPQWIDIDPSTLDQVVLNLVVNAKEALDGYGTIIVRTRSSDDHRGHVTILEVEDDGCGMEPGTLHHVFDPFFTTKEFGSGLGLATVQGIVRDAGGSIGAESAVGEGTTVTVQLPTVRKGKEPAEAHKPDDAQPELPVGQGELVLAIDDDPTVLTMIGKVLTRFGYQVIQAAGPDAARKRLQQMESPPDLSVIDISLPGQSGIELATDLRERGLVDAVLFVSGYAAPEGGDTFTVLSESGYLEKPFSINELLQAVRESIDAGAAGAGAA